MKRLASNLNIAFALFALSCSSINAHADVNKDSNIDQILDAMHDVGANLKAMAADVKLSDQDLSLGDDPKVFTGKMVLIRPAPDDTKVNVVFTKKQKGKTIYNEKQEYIVDGSQVIDRNWSSDPRKETTRVIAPEGTKLNVFKLGEGPFPLPIGQPRDEVYKQFDVKKLTDQPDQIRIELTPKADTKLAIKFKTITLTITPSGMPSEIESVDPKEIEMKTASLSQIRLNDAVKSEEYNPAKIDDSWTKVYVKYAD